MFSRAVLSMNRGSYILNHSARGSSRGMANASNNTTPTSILASASSASYPYPANILIQVRIKIVQEAERVLVALEKRKVAIEDPILNQVETVRSKVLALEYSDILGKRSMGQVLNDFTWGMNPALGLVSEEEARDNLVAEMRDITEGLVREVNQIVALVEGKRCYSSSK
ncbi:UNVERIFIED_CONTAM: hypothetical protein HDU68_009511 [Siphonaria sp. JEL0065]|nr:hypothetical protein HDU68_009511 [Siphonaria sp. JEL0065]